MKLTPPTLMGVCVMTAACLIALIVLLASGVKDGMWQGAGYASPGEDAPAMLTETPDYGSFYLSSIIFAGDRTLSGLPASGALADGSETKQVWLGEGGDLSLDLGLESANILYPEDGKAMTMAEAAAAKRPDYLLITVGLNNGVAYCSEETFKTYYGKLIDAVMAASPETKIMLQSILPISKGFEKATNGIDRERIVQANRWIGQLAIEKNVRYLHTYEALCDSQGYLTGEYDSGDGVTLSPAGYEAMTEYVRRHGYR